MHRHYALLPHFDDFTASHAHADDVVALDLPDHVAHLQLFLGDSVCNAALDNVLNERQGLSTLRIGCVADSFLDNSLIWLVWAEGLAIKTRRYR